MRPNSYVAYVPSGAVSSCLDRLERRADELAEAQLRHGVDVAVPLEGGACGLREGGSTGKQRLGTATSAIKSSSARWGKKGKKDQA